MGRLPARSLPAVARGHQTSDATTEDSPLAALVSVENGEPVGYVLVFVGDGTLYVTELAVAEEHRREGRASMLLAVLLERAAAEGRTAVTLHVHPDNDGARALYRTFGFEAVGYEEDYYENGDPAVEMKRTLED